MSVMTMAGPPVYAKDPMLPHSAVIRGIKPEAYGISTFWLSLDDPAYAATYRFAPGQFNMLYLPGFGEVAISISSDPEEIQQSQSLLGHTIRYAGNVTRGIARLKVGDRIGIRGPYGNSWPLTDPRARNMVIVAGGIGLAPLRPVLFQVMRHREAYDKVILLYGARTPQDLLYTDEFDKWQKCGIDVHVTVDRADENWRGQVGVVPLLFYRVRFDHRQTLVLTCGPEIMMRFVIYEALARRVPKDAIFVSMERNMKCAVGFCGHCQYGPTFICKNGPVLNYSQIEPFFGREDF
jgi:NAD(P)H-flavin reductase